MVIVLKRTTRTEHSTVGELSEGGVLICYTLELPWHSNDSRVSCIPEGRYRLSTLFSPHFKREVVLVNGVPGRDAIEIHVGNGPDDTHGCILVGLTKDVDFVGHSKDALAKLLERIKGVQGEEVFIDVTD